MGITLSTSTSSITTLHTSLDTVDKTLRRFWELEEIPTIPQQMPEDIECEDIYKTTTKRRPDGRYVVNLPFIQNPPQLGHSKVMAMQRLQKREARLRNSDKLCQQYNSAMQDYLDSGHMECVNFSETVALPSYYTPHHAIFKPDSLTTKVRVVYDASAITSNSKSLND